jgi:hypothetical protein
MGLAITGIMSTAIAAAGGFSPAVVPTAQQCGV